MPLSPDEFMAEHRALEQSLMEINECRVGYDQGHRDALVRMAASARNLARSAEVIATSGWMKRA